MDVASRGNLRSIRMSVIDVKFLPLFDDTHRYAPACSSVKRSKISVTTWPLELLVDICRTGEAGSKLTIDISSDLTHWTTVTRPLSNGVKALQIMRKVLMENRSIGEPRGIVVTALGAAAKENKYNKVNELVML